ncbi:hypothetical protein B0H16DRAFT_390598 [Mycena metata]|uniref:Uncharacterized protein n=1 Tax=Mycena metata TaxID=1033252 RepID=A0AAD7HGQ6_9AGAR|nr:hypothetical protein B0H16DRAFT_390598 [Mycena metata]
MLICGCSQHAATKGKPGARCGVRDTHGGGEICSPRANLTLPNSAATSQTHPGRTSLRTPTRIFVQQHRGCARRLQQLHRLRRGVMHVSGRSYCLTITSCRPNPSFVLHQRTLYYTIRPSGVGAAHWRLVFCYHAFLTTHDDIRGHLMRGEGTDGESIKRRPMQMGHMIDKKGT